MVLVSQMRKKSVAQKDVSHVIDEVSHSVSDKIGNVLFNGMYGDSDDVDDALAKKLKDERAHWEREKKERELLKQAEKELKDRKEREERERVVAEIAKEIAAEKELDRLRKERERAELEEKLRREREDREKREGEEREAKEKKEKDEREAREKREKEDRESKKRREKEEQEAKEKRERGEREAKEKREKEEQEEQVRMEAAIAKELATQMEAERLKKEKEDLERLQKEKAAADLAAASASAEEQTAEKERQAAEKERQEKDERDLRAQVEKQIREKFEKQRLVAKDMRDREDRERLERERLKDEALAREREEKERKDKKEREERERTELLERERKEKEEREKAVKEEREQAELLEKEKKDREERERIERVEKSVLERLERKRLEREKVEEEKKEREERIQREVDERVAKQLKELEKELSPVSPADVISAKIEDLATEILKMQEEEEKEEEETGIVVGTSEDENTIATRELDEAKSKALSMLKKRLSVTVGGSGAPPAVSKARRMTTIDGMSSPPQSTLAAPSVAARRMTSVNETSVLSKWKSAMKKPSVIPHIDIEQSKAKVVSGLVAHDRRLSGMIKGEDIIKALVEDSDLKFRGEDEREREREREKEREREREREREKEKDREREREKEKEREREKEKDRERERERERDKDKGGESISSRHHRHSMSGSRSSIFDRSVEREKEKERELEEGNLRKEITALKESLMGEKKARKKAEASATKLKLEMDTLKHDSLMQQTQEKFSTQSFSEELQMLRDHQVKLTEEKKKLELDYITEKSRAVYLETKIEQLESIKTQEPHEMSNRERDRYEREISKLSEETKEVKSAYSTLLASFHEQVHNAQLETKRAVIALDSCMNELEKKREDARHMKFLADELQAQLSVYQPGNFMSSFSLSSLSLSPSHTAHIFKENYGGGSNSNSLLFGGGGDHVNELERVRIQKAKVLQEMTYRKNTSGLLTNQETNQLSPSHLSLYPGLMMEDTSGVLLSNTRPPAVGSKRSQDHDERREQERAKVSEDDHHLSVVPVKRLGNEGKSREVSILPVKGKKESVRKAPIPSFKGSLSPPRPPNLHNVAFGHTYRQGQDKLRVKATANNSYVHNLFEHDMNVKEVDWDLSDGARLNEQFSPIKRRKDI